MSLPEDIEKKPTVLSRLAGGLALCVLLMIVCVVISLIALNNLGAMESWSAWRSNNYLTMLLWRLFLYSLIVVVWLRLKRQLPPSSTQAQKRLIRVEGLVLMLFLVLEVSKALIPWEEIL
ncbi:hypothetical protein D3X12_29105 [Pseudomonas protegens]|jgi:NADH:ubiquinone oxidoreductase subunit 6 (subunit J)|uniref:Uncharacterized protein n=1 Tax=Pseudomonas protegens TaxID=380021 RepID=A0ABY2VDW9_9PSED|nr:hypothetical protein [Pseudomonas protegens]ASE21879.1 hypothetical protein CEP86_15860 [Pseudomonas protegens]QEZ54436.1 hypothetical protein D3X12_29105 [Pseudomonas protegens]QEZ59359.1 hypothetical protein D4N38_22715 [Pseudomonas protegens]QEZ65723.1 hypothetical protein D4N37_24430 [Pseudomonas protegens]QIC30376.1 hypothetical protein FQ342_18730 [Pseudomonas protegens]